MNNAENFELEVILTMTTGYNYVDDFDKAWQLVWFVCDDNITSPLSLGIVKEGIKNHLLTIASSNNNQITNKNNGPIKYLKLARQNKNQQL